MDRQTVEWTDGQMNGLMLRWKDWWSEGRPDGQAEEWTDGRMDGRTDGRLDNGHTDLVRQ